MIYKFTRTDPEYYTLRILMKYWEFYYNNGKNKWELTYNINVNGHWCKQVTHSLSGGHDQACIELVDLMNSVYNLTVNI